jgi:hypothetical protein
MWKYKSPPTFPLQALYGRRVIGEECGNQTTCLDFLGGELAPIYHSKRLIWTVLAPLQSTQMSHWSKCSLGKRPGSRTKKAPIVLRDVPTEVFLCVLRYVYGGSWWGHRKNFSKKYHVAADSYLCVWLKMAVDDVLNSQRMLNLRMCLVYFCIPSPNISSSQRVRHCILRGSY